MDGLTKKGLLLLRRLISLHGDVNFHESRVLRGRYSEEVKDSEDFNAGYRVGMAEGHHSAFTRIVELLNELDKLK